MGIEFDANIGGPKRGKTQKAEEEKVKESLARDFAIRNEAESIFNTLNTSLLQDPLKDQGNDEIIDEHDDVSNFLLTQIKNIMHGAALTKQNFVNAATSIPNFIENIKNAIQKDNEQKRAQAEFRKQIEERAAGLEMYNSKKEAVEALKNATDTYENGNPVVTEKEVAFKEKGQIHILCVKVTVEDNSTNRKFYTDSIVHRAN